MLDFGFYNMDCMEGMKQFPDKYFDLAVVDPPYGDGGGQWSGAERFGERFDKYRHPENKQGGVAWETEIPPRYTISERTADSQTARGVSRTGGGWARRLDPTKKL